MARAGDRHVGKAPLLFQAVALHHALLVRKQTLLEPGQEHHVELQPLRRVHAHHLQRFLPFARLVLASLERGVGKKRGERVDRLARLGDPFFFRERRRGVHQLGQVLDAIGALALGLVVLDEAAARDDHVDELRELLAGLPRRQREVLVLHYVADLDVASIAKLLGIGVGTVKSSLSRGRQAIVRTVRAPAPATTAKEEAVTMGLKYWRVAPSDYEFGLAEGTFEGRRVASLRSTVKPARDFGACRQEIAADDYRGKRIRFAAALKAVEVTNGWAGLWLRVDGAQRGTTLAFDNMEDRAVKGTTGWQRHAIVLDVAPEAESVVFGALVFGEGELLLVDLVLEEVSRDTPVTGLDQHRPRRPQNLDFSQT